jgi:hypothetical protein
LILLLNFVRVSSHYFFFANPTFLDHFVRRFGVHISIFSVGAILCAVPAFFFLAFPFRIFHRTDTESGFIVLMAAGIVSLFIGFTGGVFCFGLALSIREVLRPFFEDLDDPYRERMALEF